MQRADFIRVFNEDIAGMYNSEAPPDFEDKLWKMVAYVTLSDFKAACIEVVRENRRFPDLAAFKRPLIEVLKRIEENQNRVAARLTNKECHYCQGSGWLNAYREAKPEIEIAFICTCDAPLRLHLTNSQGAKHWDDSMRPEFTPITVGPLGNFSEWYTKKYKALGKPPGQLEKDRKAFRKLLNDNRGEIIAGLDKAADQSTPGVPF